MLRNELLIFFPQKEFFSGDTLNGYAELRVPTSVETSGLRLDLIGRETATLQGRPNPIVNEFYRHGQILEGVGSKDHGRDWFGMKKKKIEKIPTGSYKYHFQVKLPETLPPSYKRSSSTSGSTSGGDAAPVAVNSPDTIAIEYELKVTMEAGGANTSDLTSSARVPLAGTLFDMNFLGNETIPIQERTSKTFMLTKGALDVVISLESRTFLTGDVIQPRFDIFNRTSRQVNGVEAKLIQRVQVFNHNSRTALQTFDTVMSKANIGVIVPNRDTHPTVQLSIPDNAIESVFNRRIQNGVVGRVVNISYVLNVHGTVPLATDLDMDLNLYVAKRQKHASHVRQNSSVVSTTATPPPPVVAQQQQQQLQHQLPPQQQPQQLYQQQPQAYFGVPPQQATYVDPYMQQQQQQQYMYQQQQQQQQQQWAPTTVLPPPTPTALLRQQNQQQQQPILPPPPVLPQQQQQQQQYQQQYQQQQYMMPSASSPSSVQLPPPPTTASYIPQQQPQQQQAQYNNGYMQQPAPAHSTSAMPIDDYSKYFNSNTPIALPPTATIPTPTTSVTPTAVATPSAVITTSVAATHSASTTASSSFYPTLDNIDVSSYNPEYSGGSDMYNPNIDHAMSLRDPSAASTRSTSSRNDEISLDDLMERQFGNGISSNTTQHNGAAAYEQFFE